MVSQHIPVFSEGFDLSDFRELSSCVPYGHFFKSELNKLSKLFSKTFQIIQIDFCVPCSTICLSEYFAPHMPNRLTNNNNPQTP